jgi:hypothetical protein
MTKLTSIGGWFVRHCAELQVTHMRGILSMRLGSLVALTGQLSDIANM